MNHVELYRIVPPDPRPPAGLDGKGWNRLSIHPITPIPRCGLRPRSWMAAMDLLRGALARSNWSDFSHCIASTCEGCHRATGNRLPLPEGCIIRPTDEGLALVMPDGKTPPGRGSFRTWGELLSEIDLPRLHRGMDPSGIFFKAHSERA